MIIAYLSANRAIVRSVGARSSFMSLFVSRFIIPKSERYANIYVENVESYIVVRIYSLVWRIIESCKELRTKYRRA